VASGSLDGVSVDYYETVEMTIDLGVFGGDTTAPVAEKFVIAVGNIVAVHSEEAVVVDTSPFCIQWGFAQVVSIYQTVKLKEWNMQVRWFYRHSEIDQETQERLKALEPYFSPTHCLLERLEDPCPCPIDSVLPAHVCLTSEDRLTSTSSHEDGLPVLHRRCQHLKQGAEIRRITDWVSGFQETFMTPRRVHWNDG
jgi:hypothetical protein